jgi:perosamine synthetase
MSAYRSELSDLDWISLNPEDEGTVNGAWMPSIVCSPESGISSEILAERFRSENVDARVFFHPLSSLDFFESQPENVNSYDLPKRSFNLPSYHDIEHDDIKRVAAIIRSLKPN